jgi:hypothetical protein
MGFRHAGDMHDDALSIFSGIDMGNPEMKKNVQRLSRAIGMKSDSEYGETLMTMKEAGLMAADAERFMSFVRSRMPGGCSIS